MTVSSISQYWPVTQPRHSKDKHVPPSHTSEAASPGKNKDTLKVLLVDDNIDLREMASLLFEDSGFEVVTASSGDEALQILRQLPDIDVLLTDVVMPGMSGLELGYQVRKLLPRIKIILVSGYPNLAEQAGHGSIHDFDFLKKPYRVEEVMRLLAKPN